MQNNITKRKYIKMMLEDLAQLNGSEFDRYRVSGTIKNINTF